MTTIIILVLILIILITLIVCFLYVKNKIENFSRKWFGTKDFFEGLNKQKELMEETPKTPYGIDSLILPEIIKDFPNLNVNEMKKYAENSILLTLKSIQNKRLEKFSNANVEFKNNLENIINEHKENNLKLSITNIKMHKTVINKYDQEESKCRLIFQTAVGYKVNKNGETKKYEERFNTEFIYVYNYKNIESHESISLKCPSCGAPIQDLGVKTCPYCKSGIIDLATKTWVLNNITKA
ncbi:MAG: zinc ribbon domain-containing protein [Clostridia bacterium]|nr:zinc ribbon domain-containing protein [Clostridia bacterium]